jgi:hypothetical protein
MGYRKITNLYADRNILMFKQLYALEKIHGTSAHISYHHGMAVDLAYFSGGAKYSEFIKLFDHDVLLEAFKKNYEEHPNTQCITIYGECYGGSIQKMSHTYGPELKFVAFEVKFDDRWQDVPTAHKFVQKLGLDFVDYNIIDATPEAIDAEMMKDSVHGVGSGHMREGVVLRPLMEVLYPDGVGRFIVKHKRPEFQERSHQPKITDSDKLKVLEQAEEIAEEWCNAVRLQHVLDQVEGERNIELIPKVIQCMIKDVYAESQGEIVQSKAVEKAISKKTVQLYKEYLNR